ncbi:DNA-binding domain of Mlu1-box binding protein MBP1 [Xylaria bambusicola]|uniref:DNA-binding domain of Mlu1-box binding protein MBP1 n=1 Tax=Xylaria bambusicola TaxID=326684 RepID=UPI0020077CE7|nr:DNA-binding domain of Mlu1-box binding protein MBP1 [Xylaria bambusicola]KAI0523644.1 DNA-binding domain of Mlu1-box binding protein MBP1 [Xylaria bambusicola]
MVASRHLPSKANPLMTEDLPVYAELVSRRRLGQTQLTPKMVAASAAGEVDASALGVFDYAHLRAPLPKGITSGIFKSSPSSYFLMRRSQDGYVSATGMFKATFPYAEASEEEAERKYIKSLPTTSHEETAGNVWIPPEQAMALAEEYGVTLWISALLDPTEIAITNAPDSPPKKIAAPPKFEFTGLVQPLLAPPTPSSLPRSTRSRRSASPSKKRAIASPRKRSTKVPPAQIVPSEPLPVQEETPLPVQEETEPETNGVQTEDTTSTAPTEDITMKTIEKEPELVFALVEEEPKIHIKFGQEVQFNAGVETTQTAVEVELPIANGPPSVEEAAEMIAKAKEMVAAAAAESMGNAKTDSLSSENSKGKRKVAEIADDDEEEQPSEPSDERSSKKAKTEKTEVQLRKERVRNRALVGLSATLAIGALIPYVMGVF